MEKSNHRNYIDGFDQNRGKLAKTVIIPNQDVIFNLFSQKFNSDAEKDLGRGRKKLWTLGKICADSCKNIHNILQGIDNLDPKLQELVKNICDLDYDSLLSIFQRIQLEYYNTGGDEQIINQLKDICKSLDEMRRISKNHTNVISKSK